VDTRPRMFPATDTITWKEITHLKKMGHEITSHGLRHIDYVDATNIELYTEMKVAKDIFNSRGVYPAVFTCPFNGFDQRVERMSEDIYPYVRGRTGVNKVPVEGRVYHCLSWPDAVNAITDDVWSVGAWHDVRDLERFEQTILYVGACAEVVAVEEMMKQ